MSASKTIELEIGGESVPILKLSHRRSDGWRKEFERKVSDLAPRLSVFDELKIDLKDVTGFQQKISQMFSVLDGALDLALDLVISYAAQSLPEERAKQLDDEIFDEEIVDNFIIVIRAAIPFDRVLTLFRTIDPGSQTLTTLQNYAGESMASPQTNSQPKKQTGLSQPTSAMLDGGSKN
jgi:hypothetical protein